MAKFDVINPIKEREAGRIITLLRGKGIFLKYRELTGFSPIDAAGTSKLKQHGISAEFLAKAAGREEIVKVSEVI